MGDKSKTSDMDVDGKSNESGASINYSNRTPSGVDILKVCKKLDNVDGYFSMTEKGTIVMLTADAGTLVVDSDDAILHFNKNQLELVNAAVRADFGETFTTLFQERDAELWKTRIKIAGSQEVWKNFFKIYQRPGFRSGDAMMDSVVTDIDCQGYKTKFQPQLNGAKTSSDAVDSSDNPFSNVFFTRPPNHDQTGEKFIKSLDMLAAGIRAMQIRHYRIEKGLYEKLENSAELVGQLTQALEESAEVEDTFDSTGGEKRRRCGKTVRSRIKSEHKQDGASSAEGNGG